MPDTPDELIAEWVARPENTARTVLVTIFGDSLLPVTPGVWLAQMFRLTEALGFNERLVRTSMTRLVSEGWLDNERVGRQSRYSLTDAAHRETLDAEDRIYHGSRSDWTGRWVVAFVDGPHITTDTRERLCAMLARHGFVGLGRGVMASPTATASGARELCRVAAPDAVSPVGTLEFADLGELVDDGFFAAAFDLDQTARGYEELLDFHRRSEAAIDSASGPQAFALRTMLIHDLRRLRLRSIDLPSELLPPDWPGSRALELATTMYPRLRARSAEFLSDALGIEQRPMSSARFASNSTDEVGASSALPPVGPPTAVEDCACG